MIKREYTTEELRLKAERYAAQAERSEADVRLKLRSWGADSACADTLIAHLRAHHYLDDQRYCMAYVHDQLHYHRWGKRKIAAMLYAKHLDESAIEQALNAIDPDEYRSILRHVAEQNRRPSPEATMRFLMQRGFAIDEIRSTLGY